MKKLMIAAAIVCAAVASQAVQYDWSFYTADGVRNGWTAADGKAVVSDSYAGAGLKAYLIAYSSSFDQDDLLQAVRGGSDVATAAGANLIKSSVTDSAGKVVKVSWNEEAASAPTINAFLAVVNTDGSSIFLSSNSSFAGAEDPNVSDITFATTYTRQNKDAAGTKAYTAAGWYAVPEPTSGLLLLIGVAGLALRRRRA